MPEPIIAPLETMAASNRLSLRMLRVFYRASRYPIKPTIRFLQVGLTGNSRRITEE